MEGLNRFQKSENGSKILVLGVSYKKNIDDVRESPTLDSIYLLTNSSTTVTLMNRTSALEQKDSEPGRQ